MIHCEDKVRAPNDEVACFVAGVNDGEGFPFHWGVAGFCPRDETALNIGYLPACFGT